MQRNQNLDPAHPATYRRNYSRVLHFARSRGAVIVADVNGVYGTPVEFAPRARTDSKPWRPTDPALIHVRLSGNQCRVQEETTCRFSADATDYAVTAYVANRAVGHLTWRRVGGEVRYVWVSPEYRRRRIATAMWKYANRRVDSSVRTAGAVPITAPRHARELSPEGRLWIASLHSTKVARWEAAKRGEAS